ncbi:WD40-like Beta Propeller Repeat [Draconibacterium orientale]|uniref:WD40-like Beta Propeller Repeat n=2 Tax=Draconibacterium orientale TaxID=1168034 RepID=A0A1H9YL31_9BACT|nr:WD40-like Beta Propeller Repeat [Draconibacterium orientale]
MLSMSKLKKLLVLIVCGVCWVSTFAQDNKRSEKLFEEARRYYVEDSYPAAIETADKILQKDPGYAPAHLLLAEIYKDIDSTRLEIKHLTQAVELDDNPLIDFRLGEAFYKLGMYSEALSFYEKYTENKDIPEKRQFLLACKIASCRFAINSIANPVAFEPTNLGDEINTPNDEYWPTPSLDGKHLVFTRLMKDGGRPQEDFFMAGIDSFNWDNAIPISEVNTSDNEGAQTLSADAKILFFTACNREDGLGSCDIYFSRLVEGKWTEPRNAGAPLNSSSWEGQPSLSSDNRYLYFSSNRPGGKGQKDIWRIAFNGFAESGEPQWGKPENMDALNTSGDEISPFIHANNHNFYFASDTHVGMGGLDLFTAEINENGKVENLKNMGYPINTYQDDMGLTISSIGDVAYFSSARESENGLDIFSFNLDRGLQPRPVTYIRAKVTNKVTTAPIMADIELVNLNSSVEEPRIEKADENGQIMLALPVGRNYAFNVSEDGFMFYSQSMRLADENSLTDPFILNIDLEPIEVGAEMDLHNIYYETDSFAILSESEPELQKLVSFLKNNSGLKVEIQGHTDSSGNPESNLELSKLRAKSVVDYLVENGIPGSRLQSQGYGDTKAVATNETVEGRRLNRRTTIKVIAK